MTSSVLQDILYALLYIISVLGRMPEWLCHGMLYQLLVGRFQALPTVVVEKLSSEDGENWLFFTRRRSFFFFVRFLFSFCFSVSIVKF